MPSKSAGSSTIACQIEEMKQKIQLSAGDKKAFCDNSEIILKENREKILRLRHENKQQRKEVAKLKTANEMMVSREITRLPEEKKFLAHRYPDVVLGMMDEKTCDTTNILNMARCETRKKETELQSLKKQNGELNAETSLDDGSKLRELENQVDKTNMKCREAEHIRSTYHQIKSKLEEEQTTYGNVLDEAELEIKRLRSQLKELKSMQSDVLSGREAAKVELEKREKDYQLKKKKRESELERARKEADDLKHKVVNLRHKQKDQQNIAGSYLSEYSGEMPDTMNKLKTYDETFSAIKEATGVSDTKEVVRRFENQKERQIQLSEMKENNDAKIDKLLMEKEDKLHELQQLQFSLDEKAFDIDQQLKENLETELNEKERTKENTKANLEKYSKLLTEAKAGVEHLIEKLKVLQITPQNYEPKSSRGKDENILDQLDFCKERLMSLYSEERLLDAILEDSIAAGFKSNQINTKSLQSNNINDSKYEEFSDEDEEEMARHLLKKQSQEIIESKNRMRQIKRKKKLN